MILGVWGLRSVGNGELRYYIFRIATLREIGIAVRTSDNGKFGDTQPRRSDPLCLNNEIAESLSLPLFFLPLDLCQH